MKVVRTKQVYANDINKLNLKVRFYNIVNWNMTKPDIIRTVIYNKLLCT